jgi:glucan endo-1,3-beta-D-glucosidase
MHPVKILAALAATFTSVSAVAQGFNYGSSNSDGSAKDQARFTAEFKKAKNLAGTNHKFTSARLYTMIQAGTTNTPISAIPAAINTKTTLLLGLWASAGQDAFNNELAALGSAISQYGTKFTDLVVGISIGSEDLYRISPTGEKSGAGTGAAPADLVKYIKQVRNKIKGTSLAGTKLGHVDTWTAWVNGTNSPVITAVDWLGVDAYPYFQNTDPFVNSIQHGKAKFFDAYDNTTAVSKGKPVWIAETGWPVSGPKENAAVASIANAKTYWDQVGCSVFGKHNTWWYTLQDAYPTTPSPSFGIVGTDLSSHVLYDLSC